MLKVTISLSDDTVNLLMPLLADANVGHPEPMTLESWLTERVLDIATFQEMNARTAVVKSGVDLEVARQLQEQAAELKSAIRHPLAPG